jgi:hypothetical protein
MEWKPLIGFHVYRYQGDMIHMKNKSFDFMVTPNHKWVVCNDRTRGKLNLEEAQKLNSKHIIRRISDNVISLNDNPKYEDDFIAIVGWLAADGTVCKSHTTIYQSLSAYPEKCNKIDEITKQYGSEVKQYTYEYAGTTIEGNEWQPPDGKARLLKRWNFSGNIRKRVHEVMDGKTINPSFVCSLSTRQLQILFDSIVDGDGYRVKENSSVRISQINNESLMDTFHLISTLLGRLARKSKWEDCRGKCLDGVHVYANSERYWAATHVKSLDVDHVPYDGFVWCPSTENRTVVVRRNGTVSISGNSYTFDDVWNMADFIFRTECVAKITNQPQVEHRGTGKSIACIQAATDDNPSLNLDTIERIFSDIIDPDELMIRRFGVFKQISGRVHKSYDPSVCYIPMDKHFPNGIPYNWFHARGIDYHESRTPWSIGWVSCSPLDEWFLWQEFHPAIDGPNAYSTHDIARAIARKSGSYYYGCNLIDPLANKKQPNTLFSATDDLNRYFDQLVKTEGLGTPCFWQGWDTKGTTGRDGVAKRFKNAVKCGKPFNNLFKDNKGMSKRLPTLWIMNTCPKFHHSILNWSYGEWVSGSSKIVNDPKSTPQQKNSHDNMVLECLAKDQRLLFAPQFMKHNASANQRPKTLSTTGRC